MERLEPLRDAAEALDAAAGEEVPGRAAYVVVVTRELVDPYSTVPLLSLRGRQGVVDRNHAPGDLATYDPLPELEVPGRRTCWWTSTGRGVLRGAAGGRAARSSGTVAGRR